jgi:GMP synthase-like glutamine amidotransferase
MRLGFVISEHRGGLQPESLARYRQAADRLAGLARADIATSHYTDIDALDADAIVLSGSYDPWSAHDVLELERLSEALRAYEGPVLGICAGMQTLVRAAGGEISAADRPTAEGFATVDVLDGSDLLSGLEPRVDVFQHHTDEISDLPDGFRVLASSESCAIEALAAQHRVWWGTQFHPEEWSAEHPAGRVVLENFLHLAGIGAR